jgi:flagellin FlaA/flagellin FlaB
VFIAMVLVAAIAAGVLINTAGFLQSKSQQTGEESSAQVTNQLQVVSKTGIVNQGGESSTDMVTIEASTTSNPDISIDSESTLTLTIDDSADEASQVVLGSSQSGTGTITVGESNNGSPVDEKIKLEVFNDSGTQKIRVTSVETGASLSFDPTEGDLTFKENDQDPMNDADTTLTIENTFSDTEFGDSKQSTSFTLSKADTTSSTGVSTDTRTSQYVVLTGADSNQDTLIISNQETVTAGSNTDDAGNLQVGSNGPTLDVDQDNELIFETVSATEFKITNQNTGSSITVGAEENLGATGGAVSLKTDGDTAQVNGGSDFGKAGDNTARYLFARQLTDSNAVTQVNLLVAGSAGAGDIDMSQTVISARTPQGSFTLNFGQTAVENEQFTITAVQDEDDTAPVLTSGDRFELNLDLGTLEGGDTVGLRITTGSGATKVVQLRVPDSLASKEAVGL